MSRYLVTGLPRSRTAWFSVVAGMHGRPCWHEPTRYLQSWDDLKAFWLSGISDHALGFQLGRILAEIEPRTLIVERERKAVEHSLAMANIEINTASSQFLNELETALNDHKRHPLVKRVAYDALNDYGTVVDCLEWLQPDGANYWHVKDMMRLNIQVERSVIEREAQMKHNFWFRP